MWRRIVLTIVLLGGLLHSAVALADANDPLLNVEHYLTQQIATNRLPGLALAVVQKDRVLTVRGYGTARADQPVNGKTQFFVGSVSKSFTALAVMQLLEAGQFWLDDPVQQYLPDFTLADPEMARRLTIRHLLNQTSGLSEMDFNNYAVQQPTTLQESVAQLRAVKPGAAPGTQWDYFNPNYMVLAYLVEKVSGQPFNDYLREHIFEPLEMAHTLNVGLPHEANAAAPTLADGHAMCFAFPVARQEDLGFLSGAGGVISTAEDMANYLTMFLNQGVFKERRIISRESIYIMQTSGKITMPAGTIRPTNYGMGWYPGRTPGGLALIQHGGALNAFHADMVLIPDQGYGFMILINANYLLGGLSVFPEITAGVADLLAGKPTSAPGWFNIGTFGAFLGFLAVLMAALNAFWLLRFRRWRQRIRQLSWLRLLPGFLLDILPLVSVAGMPTFVTLYARRGTTLGELFPLLPDLIALLVVAGGIGLIRIVVKVFLCVQQPHPISSV